MTMNRTKVNINGSQSLTNYLQEIGKVPLLKPEEEIDLAKITNYKPNEDPGVVAGGKPKYSVKQQQDAMDKLIQSNLRFVVSEAKKYQNRGLPLGDLINEGNLGLIKAAQRFDVTRGFKFISYAVWWIKQSIRQALAEHTRIVRLPLNRVGELNKIIKMNSILEQQFERKPTPDEIAIVLGLKTEQVIDAMKLSGKHISLDAPFSEGEDNRLLDVIANTKQPAPDTNLMNESLKMDVDRMLDTLTPREAQVLRMYFGIGVENVLTLQEIGKKFRLTRERVRQIKGKALRRLRYESRSKLLRVYLG